MRKHIVLKAGVFIILIYLIYKVIVYLVLDFKITNDNVSPEINLSQLVNLSENRVNYNLNYYINNDFVGFNAFIDKNYFITVTKLGKISGGYKLTETDKRPKQDVNFNFFSFSNVEDKSGRYIDLENYPFKTARIYYYLDKGHISNINEYGFYEIVADFSFFNISFENEERRDFGYVGYVGRQSISFIVYNGDFYVLNLIPVDSAPFKSLHDLSNK